MNRKNRNGLENVLKHSTESSNRKCLDTTCIFHSYIFVDVCNIDKNTVGLSFEKDCPFEIVKRHKLKLEG